MIHRDEKESDVLGNILQGSQAEGAPVHQGIDELTSILERYSKPLISGDIQPELKTPELPAQTVSVGKKEKKKTTHYLTNEVFNELDQANNFLKGLLPPGSKLLSTKSKIVNHAVKMLLDDFESKGEESELVKKLLKDSKE